MNGGREAAAYCMRERHPNHRAHTGGGPGGVGYYSVLEVLDYRYIFLISSDHAEIDIFGRLHTLVQDGYG